MTWILTTDSIALYARLEIAYTTDYLERNTWKFYEHIIVTVIVDVSSSKWTYIKLLCDFTSSEWTLENKVH